ncbi:MAG TPA: YibE/F family protein [Propioniciclava sp.]|uniref:YibE/F family protein n=2 Tax=Propioniciclava sp. TaxID=2038686 RepID=UPI002C0ED588|nr:YibE/F family protein [Propioniciclava sp.]HRL48179.1 YibE/F family protein [Propioniciclava sp.]
MGAGHSHSHEAPALGLSATARRATLALLVVVGVVTIAGLIWLWPISHPSVGGSSMTAEGVDAVSGRITALAPCEDTGESSGQGPQHACQIAQVEITGGPSAGQTVPVELIGVSGLSGLQVGDGVNVAEVAGIDGEASTWAFVTADRMPVLIGFLIVFVLAVLGVAGRKGLFGLLGLIVAGAVLFGFMIPALTSGHPAVAVAIIGSTAIMFVVLYLAHGISWRTTSAFVGTWLSLIVTTGLGALGVWMARLSGMSSEETLALAGVLGNLDFPDILTCSLVIGGLGVLNDVTITQASSVWEIRAAGPHLTRRQLFTSGMRIGRDHIASTIYTIVFAYAGASLSLLLLLSLYDQPLNLLLSTEQFSEEIIRTLGSGIGLVLSVPLTTGVAALTVAGSGVVKAPDPARPRRAA